MIIPIGHDETHLKGVPWVTFSLIAICTLIVIFQTLFFNAEKQARENELGLEIFQYYKARQEYLQLPSTVKTLAEALENQNRHQGPAAEINEFMEQMKAEAEAAEAFQQQIFDEYGVPLEGENPFRGYSDDSDEDYNDFSQPEDFDQLEEKQSPQPVEPDVEEEQAHLDKLVAELHDCSRLMWSFKWGYVPLLKNKFGLISYLFMHDGWLHLIGNMLFLYLFGAALESRYGGLYFSCYYLLGGIFAGIMHGLHYPDSLRVLIGASGAVFAVMGCYVVHFWNSKINFLFFLGFRPRTFAVAAWVAIPMMFTKELLYAWITSSIEAGVAYWAHVWGFIFGVGLLALIKKSGLEQRFSPEEIDLGRGEDSSLREAIKQERLGHPDQALILLRSGFRDTPDDADLLQNYWRLAKTLVSRQDIVKSGQQLMELDLANEAPKMAHLRFKEILEVTPDARFSAQFCNRLAESLAKDHYYLETEEVLRRTFETLPQPSTRLLMPMMEVAAEMEHELGLEIAQAIRQCDDFNQENDLAKLEQRINDGLAKGSPAADSSISIASGGVSIALADSPEFQPLEAPAKNVHSLKIFPADPQKMDQEGIHLIVNEKPIKVPYQTIKLIAVAVIREQGKKNVLIIDLVFDRPQDILARHRVMRLNSTRFNPLKLFPKMTKPADAYRRLVEVLLKGSGADAAPSNQAAVGRPYQDYPNLRSFERAIYYGD